MGDKLRAVIRADMRWDAPKYEEIRQGIDYIHRLQLAAHPDLDTFARKLVDHVQHAIFPAIMGSILDEVVRPDVVGIFGT